MEYVIALILLVVGLWLSAILITERHERKKRYYGNQGRVTADTVQRKKKPSLSKLK